MARARTPGAVGALVVAALAALAIAALAWLVLERPGLPGSPPTPSASDAAPMPPAGIPPRPPDAVPLSVAYVYDGDTIRAQAPVAGDLVTTTEPIRIRIIGVDTPEGTPTVECGADEARVHLRALLPEGATVWAAPDRDSWDRYGRRLFDLWTDDGRFIAYELVAAGDARTLRIPPNTRHADVLRDAEAAAQADGRGLWGACG